MQQLPRTCFTHNGLQLDISVIPVDPSRRGAPGHRPVGILGPGEAELQDDWTPLRDKVREKAGHYGRLRRPLVVAVNMAGRHVEHLDVM